MDWAAICTAIESAIAQHVGLRTYWAERPQPFADPNTMAVCRLQILDSGAKGTDDNRNEPSPDGLGIVQVRVGNRWFICRVAVESYRQDPAHAARLYLENLRPRLWFDSVTNAWDAIRLALVDDGQLHDADRPKDSRMSSCAYLDLRFSYTSVARDDGNVGGTIEHVGLVSPLTGDFNVNR